MSNAINAPSFEVYAQRVLEATVAGDEAISMMRDAIGCAFQGYLDEACTTLDRSEASCKALMAEIRGAQCFVDAAAIGLLEKATISNYAQGAARAFFHGVPWTAAMFRLPEYALPWSGKAKESAAKAKPGKVQSTTRKDLDKTICALLQQARLLGLTEFAAEILDLALDSLDGFEESKAALI